MRERLYRSRSDRMLFGVAGGMADWMDLDPAVVRLVWALLVLAGGVGIVLYIVAAIVIPEAPFGASAMPPPMAPPGAVGSAPGAAPGAAGAAGSEQARWEARQARRAARGQDGGRGAVIVGIVLVIIGAWFLIRRLLPSFDTGWLIPGVLIVVGILLVLGALGRSRDGDPA